MLPRYVLVTPARDEARFIELTIQSVVAQTVRPIKWVIVSDGSTDGTDEIVKRYIVENTWIELVRMPERQERHFAGKVLAFNAGYARFEQLEYEAIGNLDGDVSFDKDYFSFLLERLCQDHGLGVVGTPYTNDHARSQVGMKQPGKSDTAYDYRFATFEHVPGACQLFRRECFEEIGGYKAVKGGGIDFIAALAAKAAGWKTRSFGEKVVVHHGVSGTRETPTLVAEFRNGVRDYAIGNHPVWEFFRVMFHMSKKPILIGGLAQLCGYLWSLVRRTKRPISRELITLHRQEQMQRLRRLVGEWTRKKKISLPVNTSRSEPTKL